jgi:mRNA-degrading endonuclease RelE of RelBE toxin-antitoxin system
VKAHVTREFRKHLFGLPPSVQAQTKKSFELWRENHYHKSLQFKRVSRKQAIYSVRVGSGYRALGFIEGGEIYWFWIGPHGEYDTLLKRL